MTETTDLSGKDLIRLADPFAQLMNQMQTTEGERIHEVVAAGLYAMGCALAQIGTHIDVHASITETLAPLALGYNEAIERVKKKMI